MPKAGTAERTFLAAWARGVVTSESEGSDTEFKQATRDLVSQGYSGTHIHSAYLDAMGRVTDVGDIGPDSSKSTAREELTRFLVDTTYSEGVLPSPHDERQFMHGNRVLEAAGVKLDEVSELIVIAHVSARTQVGAMRT